MEKTSRVIVRTVRCIMLAVLTSRFFEMLTEQADMSTIIKDAMAHFLVELVNRNTLPGEHNRITNMYGTSDKCLYFEFFFLARVTRHLGSVPCVTVIFIAEHIHFPSLYF